MLMPKIDSLPTGYITGFPLLFAYISEADELVKFLGSLVLLFLTVLSLVDKFQKSKALKLDNELKEQKLKDASDKLRNSDF
jgi:arginine exporter protein ArgO